MSTDQQTERFPLKDVIEKLRSELAEAINQAQGKDLQFKVKEIELELKTVIEDGKQGNGGFNFSVLKFGGGFTEKNAETQTIKLKLEPLKSKDPATKSGESPDQADADDPSVRITGRARRIS